MGLKNLILVVKHGGVRIINGFVVSVLKSFTVIVFFSLFNFILQKIRAADYNGVLMLSLK